MAPTIPAEVALCRDSYQGQPSVAVTEDEIILAGDSNNVTGLIRTSVFCFPESEPVGDASTGLLRGGYYRLNPLLLTCSLHHPHSIPRWSRTHPIS